MRKKNWLNADELENHMTDLQASSPEKLTQALTNATSKKELSKITKYSFEVLKQRLSHVANHDLDVEYSKLFADEAENTMLVKKPRTS